MIPITDAHAISTTEKARSYPRRIRFGMNTEPIAADSAAELPVVPAKIIETSTAKCARAPRTVPTRTRHTRIMCRATLFRGNGYASVPFWFVTNDSGSRFDLEAFVSGLPPL